MAGLRMFSKIAPIMAQISYIIITRHKKEMNYEQSVTLSLDVKKLVTLIGPSADKKNICLGGRSKNVL